MDNFEYPNLWLQESVAKWKYNVGHQYPSLDDIHKCQISELRWYKNVAGLKHEYIVVTCSKAGEAGVFLRLERRPADTKSLQEQALPGELIETFTDKELDAYKADVVAEQKSINQAVRASVQKSGSLKPPSMSDDSVMRVDSPQGSLEEQGRLMARYRDFQRPFYMRDLAFLALAISEHKREYTLFINQCYWYARTLVNTAGEIYQPATIIREDDFKWAGTYIVASRKITMNQDSQAEVSEIENTFHKSITDNNVKVQAEYDIRFGELKKQIDENAVLRERIRELEARSAQRSNSN